jgi:hypothetical protein
MEQNDAGRRGQTFICPRTGLIVQHRTECASERDDEYEGISCPACCRLHLLSLKTGKLLGDQTNQGAASAH